MAKTYDDFDKANTWQKLNDNKKDNHSNKKDYDAEYLNNKKADSVLRAERMTDKELLDAYEKEYVASKEKPPVMDQKNKSLPMEAFRKLINWVIVKLNELAEIAKATLLRVAIGKDGVSKVIDNTRKDEEKAERQQKLDPEPIDNTLDNTHEAGNESSNFSVIANFGGEDISAFTPLEDCGEQVFGDDDLDQMFNFENELDNSNDNVSETIDAPEEEEEIGA